jgi:hypothetical protein
MKRVLHADTFCAKSKSFPSENLHGDRSPSILITIAPNAATETMKDERDRTKRRETK